MLQTHSDETGSASWPGSPPRSPNALGISLAYHLLRLGLGSLLVYAGIIKLMDPKAFARALAQFDLLPEPLLPVVALGLPLLEVLAGAGLILAVRGSLGTVLALLGLFLAVLGYAIFMEMDIDCGCFTAAELSARTGVKDAFFRDLGLAAMAVFLLWRRRARSRPLYGNRF